MSNVKDYIFNQSDKVSDTYKLQTDTFGPIEFPLLIELFNKYKIKTVLDIGTGEGNWIQKLASIIKDVQITAIDADEKLIDTAKANQIVENINFHNAMFNKDYSSQTYDCILARFSMEHVDNPEEFVKEAFKRLNSNGLFVVNEWFIDIHYNTNPIWIKFLKKMNQVYEERGAHARLALSLPFWIKQNGFNFIKSSYHYVSPATVSLSDFYNLTITYALFYNKLRPLIFTDDFTKELIEYCNDCIKNAKITEDYFLITQTIGIRIR